MAEGVTVSVTREHRIVRAAEVVDDEHVGDVLSVSQLHATVRLVVDIWFDIWFFCFSRVYNTSREWLGVE